MELRLPSLPATRARAIALLLKQDVVLADLAAVVESDPGLITAVIRAANSASPASVDPVHTAGAAIVRLGISGVRRIVVAMMLRHNADDPGRSLLNLDELWRYLLATGLLADAAIWVAEGANDDKRSLAFTAGMLHKMGRIAMAGEDPERYAQVVELVRAGRDEIEAEREVWGIDHVALGLQSGAEWGIPDEVLQGIAGQYDGGSTDIPRAVHRGRRIALALGYSDGLTPPLAEPAELDPIDIQLVEHLGGREQLAVRIKWYRGALPG